MPEYAWIDRGDGHKVFRRVPEPEESKRSHLACPLVVSDYIPDAGPGGSVKSMVDGKYYSSKSALRRHYRERGYIEVGNEKQEPPKKTPPDRKGIREAIRKAAAQTGFYSD